MKIPWIDFLKVLYFLLVGYAILKDFSYLLGAKSPVENSTGTSCQLTSTTVSDILLCSRHMSIIFSRVNF